MKTGNDEPTPKIKTTRSSIGDGYRLLQDFAPTTAAALMSVPTEERTPTVVVASQDHFLPIQAVCRLHATVICGTRSFLKIAWNHATW